MLATGEGRKGMSLDYATEQGDRISFRVSILPLSGGDGRYSAATTVFLGYFRGAVAPPHARRDDVAGRHSGRDRGEGLSLGGAGRAHSLFSDIRGFTSLCESRTGRAGETAERIFLIYSVYRSGTGRHFDGYIGDAVMAGSKESERGDVQDRHRPGHRSRHRRQRCSPDRKNNTVMRAPVILASRIESLTKAYGTHSDLRENSRGAARELSGAAARYRAGQGFTRFSTGRPRKRERRALA